MLLLKKVVMVVKLVLMLLQPTMRPTKLMLKKKI
jgi:hypothetical protein